jgi:hypothetical protein
MWHAVQWAGELYLKNKEWVSNVHQQLTSLSGGK